MRHRIIVRNDNAPNPYRFDSSTHFQFYLTDQPADQPGIERGLMIRLDEDQILAAAQLITARRSLDMLQEQSKKNIQTLNEEKGNV